MWIKKIFSYLFNRHFAPAELAYESVPVQSWYNLMAAMAPNNGTAAGTSSRPCKQPVDDKQPLAASLVITDEWSAVQQVADHPFTYRVVSISSPLYLKNIAFPKAREVLYLKFDDVTTEEIQMALENGSLFNNGCHCQLASEEDCRAALEFLKQGGPCLVHCRAGIGRSTAVALGYLLSVCPNHEEAVDTLFVIRPCARPNTHVLKVMCRILGREHEYPQILDYINNGRRRMEEE